MTFDSNTLQAIFDYGVGGGAFLAGVGLFIATIAFARTLGRLNKTLDVVDGQLVEIGPATTATLHHLSSAAGGAEKALGHLAGAAKSIEGAAGALNQSAELSKNAFVPGVASLGESINLIAERLKRLLGGNPRDGGNT